jgi:hypothetical protein
MATLTERESEVQRLWKVDSFIQKPRADCTTAGNKSPVSKSVDVETVSTLLLILANWSTAKERGERGSAEMGKGNGFCVP